MTVDADDGTELDVKVSRYASKVPTQEKGDASGSGLSPGSSHRIQCSVLSPGTNVDPPSASHQEVVVKRKDLEDQFLV